MFRLMSYILLFGAIFGPALGYSYQDGMSSTSWQSTTLSRKVDLVSQLMADWCQDIRHSQVTVLMACEWPRLLSEYSKSVGELNRLGSITTSFNVDSFYHLEVLNSLNADIFATTTTSAPLNYYEHILLKNKVILASFYFISNLNLDWVGKHFIHTYFDSKKSIKSFEIVRSQQLADFLIELISSFGALNAQDYLFKQMVVKKNLIKLGYVNFTSNIADRDVLIKMQTVSLVQVKDSEKMPDEVKKVLIFLDLKSGSPNSRVGPNPAFFLFQENPTNWITRIFDFESSAIYLNWLRSRISEDQVIELEQKIQATNIEAFKNGRSFCSFLNEILFSDKSILNDTSTGIQSLKLKCHNKSIPNFIYADQFNIWPTLGLALMSKKPESFADFYQYQEKLELNQQEVNFLVNLNYYFWIQATSNELMKYKDLLGTLSREKFDFWVKQYLEEKYVLKIRSEVEK